MSDDNSRADKPTDESEESPDEATTVTTISEDATSPTSIEADLGASALVELDAADIDQGVVETRTLTTGGEPFGIELGLRVGSTRAEVVLDPEATAALADELADATEAFEERGEL
jgi:hypothetical protein